jgi:hypothetical protein
MEYTVEGDSVMENKVVVTMLEWNEKKGHSEYAFHKKYVNAGAALNAVNRLHKKYPDNERINIYCEYPREVVWQDPTSKEKFKLDCNEDVTFPYMFPNWMIYEETA